MYYCTATYNGYRITFYRSKHCLFISLGTLNYSVIMINSPQRHLKGTAHELCLIVTIFGIIRFKKR